MPENANPEKIELEPVTPTKYPEELDKLAKEIEEMQGGKREAFSSEFGAVPKTETETPKTKQPRKRSAKKVEKAPEVSEKKVEKELPEPAPALEKNASEVAPVEDPNAKEETRNQEEIDRVRKIGMQLRLEDRPASPGFDYEKVLNDEKFLDFLTKYPDAELVDPNINKGEIENRHKVYEAKNSLGNKLSELYKQEIASQLGLPTEEGVIQKIVESLGDEAVKNPDSFIGRAQDFIKYQSLRSDIEGLNAQIIAAGGVENKEAVRKKLEETARKEKWIRKDATGWRGFFNPRNSEIIGWTFQRLTMNAEARAWHQSAREMPKAERSKIFAKLDKEIDDLAKFPEKEREFNKLKQELFEDFEPMKNLFEVLKQKAVEKLHNMIQKGEHGIAGIKNLEDAQHYLEKVKLGKKAFNLKDFDPELFQVDIDQRLEELVDGMIRKHIAEFKVASKPLESMLAGFTKLINRDSDPKNRSMVATTIMSAIDKSIDSIKEGLRSKQPDGAKTEIAKMLLLQVVKNKLFAELQK